MDDISEWIRQHLVAWGALALRPGAPNPTVELSTRTWERLLAQQETNRRLAMTTVRGFTSIYFYYGPWQCEVREEPSLWVAMRVCSAGRRGDGGNPYIGRWTVGTGGTAR